MKINTFKYTNNITQFKGIDFNNIPKASFKKVGNDNISGQENCWKLYKPEVFEQFIRADSELSELTKNMLEIARVYGLTPSVDLFRGMKKMHPEIKEFYELLKSKYNIDLDVPPKVYRFIGKSELEALQRDGKVIPSRGYSNNFDVTLNPDLNWNDYRITFKPKKEFSVLDSSSNMKENLGTNHDYFYHYKGAYTIDDIENIEQYRIL